MKLIDKYEAAIISVFIIALTAALMGAFVGYTFGRIFNHAQGKE